jgi:hypothetical protein
MSGAIPPLPQYAFMAWYSVKTQGQLYLYLYFKTNNRNTINALSKLLMPSNPTHVALYFQLSSAKNFRSWLYFDDLSYSDLINKDLYVTSDVLVILTERCRDKRKG